MLFTYVLLRIQQWLPLNPQGLGKCGGGSLLQHGRQFRHQHQLAIYTPETTMSYFSQMVALATHNFWSAAAGIGVAIAFVRGFRAPFGEDAGQFLGGFHAVQRSTSCCRFRWWARCCWFRRASFRTSLRTPRPTTLEGAVQTIPQGPVASQEAIKMIGTNGGGFTNANSAHPFENPTPFSNFLQMLFIFIIPAGLTYTFGKMVKDTRQGWAHLRRHERAVPGGRAGDVSLRAGRQSQPGQAGHCRPPATGTQPGGNMEGKEVRFGIANSALFTTITTDASCGAVNNMHDSLTPLGGLVPLVNIELGEVIFGGVGAGLYGMLLFAMLAVFIAGLMVGRTPEYLGKKIEQKEVKMMMLAVLVLAFTILGFAAPARWSSSPTIAGSIRPARDGQPEQQRAARPFRDPLRLYQRHRQQRQRVRRHQRQHAVSTTSPWDSPCCSAAS